MRPKTGAKSTRGGRKSTPAQRAPARRATQTRIPDLAFDRVSRAETGWLNFDPENPRFAVHDDMKGAKLVDVIQELERTADLKELIASIAANGYIDIEPLIVMREAPASHYIVLEGNRRLAALKLLTNPKLAAEAGVSLPGFSKRAEESFKFVSVYRVRRREEARAFIGFKHINGPHAWDSLAKARFAADWYAREKDGGTTLRDIARMLGDGHATVKRLVQGVYVLDQARDAGIFVPDDRYPGKPFGFSHLYTALTRPGFREFLSLAPDWHSNDPTENPVPKEGLGNLKQILVWLYGSGPDKIPPAITSQNPDVKRLGEVLENPIARKAMLATSNLEAAYAEVETESHQLEQSLLKAYRHAEEAQGKLSSFEGGDEALVQVANRLNKAASFIYEAMSDVQAKRSSKPARRVK